MLYRKPDYIPSYKKGCHMKTDGLNPVLTVTMPSGKITQRIERLITHFFTWTKIRKLRMQLNYRPIATRSLL